MRFTTYVLLLFRLSLLHAALQPSEDFPHSLELEPDEDFHVFWKYDDTTITFEVHARTKGYVGFGMSPNGGMAGGDMVIGWVQDGTAYLHDRHGMRDGEPPIDDHQDWYLLSGSETETHTVLKFYRKLVTCDIQDMDITTDTIRLIWSHHPTDPAGATGLPYHGGDRRGTKSVQLITNKKSSADYGLPEDVFSLDFVNHKVTIPADSDTTYWCRGFRMPNLNGIKHHVIRFDPVITPGNEAMVHHVVVYACDNDTVTETPLDEYIDVENLCYEKMPMCNGILAAWGPGEKWVLMPENVGIPFGGEGDDQPVLILLEVHYDNPTLQKGVLDSSGMRLMLTPTLREIEAGMGSFGVLTSTFHVVPPGVPRFVSSGYCVSQCTEKALNGTDIKIFAVFLHSHLAGVALRVRHFRDGEELPLIIQDEHYDFNFQETRLLPEEVVIKPGDTILTECDYKTDDRTHVTVGGLGTRDEMCIAFMYYYPNVDLALCSSYPSAEQSLGIVGHVQVEYRVEEPYHIVTAPEKYKDMTIDQVLDDVDWTDGTMVTKFQQAVSHGPILGMCTIKEAFQFYVAEVPDYVKPYEPKTPECYLDSTLADSSVRCVGRVTLVGMMAISATIFLVTSSSG